ncbi:uncharacterized mitochondrial protein AtMg01250-like [Helianthus annuus]|uniref:uncharacterized mitochondrial protein AtMg01250-like n=1 Tax=Helianthus annuus TaxID=4232 RepID=UPI000B9041DC|nr:uncharacterized mitochondrial protein AtMg01250-like [Helianthus annuus]
MREMGFPDLWCRWILGVSGSARSSILVNGAPTFEFQCGKGIRQGDPLSPFLFLIVMEAFSCLLVKAVTGGMLQGIQMPNGGLLISHLLYADDAIILGERSDANILNVVRILRVFYMCSGLKINLCKSKLYGLGMDMDEVKNKAMVVGCKAESTPFKYLGLMVGANMN